MTLHRVSIAILSLAFLGAPARAEEAAPALPSYAEPGISPDHREIAFVSGGDIWTVPSTGGTARLLVSLGATESRPLYSPDGTKLAFTSSRTGNGDVYVLTINGGDLKRLTYDDGADQVENWSPDGTAIYFSTNAKNISYDAEIERISIRGGTPMPVVNERYVNQYDAAPARDGSRLAYVSGGFANAQWWRRGHAHIDESTIAIKTLGTEHYDAVTRGDAKELWPMWSPDDRTLFYVSDRSGNDNLWSIVPGAKPHKLTNFTTDRVLWPAMSHDGHTIVFEREFGIWSYDVASGIAKPVAIERRGLPARVVDEEQTVPRYGNLVLSPDGKKIALSARGQIFAASAKVGGDAQRVTHTFANEAAPVWSPNSRKLAYISDRAGGENIYLYDFTTNAEVALTHGTDRNAYPVFSPDGKTIVYQRNAHALRAIDIASRADRELAAGTFDEFPDGSSSAVKYSPAGDWIAYQTIDAKGFSNVRVVRPSGGVSHPISFLANSYTGSIGWSPDGTRLYFSSAQRTEGANVAQIDLVPRAPKFREDAFRKLFQEVPSPPSVPGPYASAKPTPAPSTASVPKPDPIDFAGIRERLSLLPTGLDIESAVVSPDGKLLLLNANAAGQQNLYLYGIDDLVTTPAVPRQLTSSPGRKSNEQFAPDGKSVFYLENGRPYVTMIDGHTPPKALPLTAQLDVDFDRDKLEMFSQAWSYLNDGYYDPHFHGVDWNAVHARYLPHVRGARTPDEVRRLLNLMVGELDSSHSGVGAPPPPFSPPPPTGYLGVRYDPGFYAREGRLRVSEVISLGPADLTHAIAVGDDVLAVDGTVVGAHTNIDELLTGKAGKRTVLRIAPHGALDAARDITILPTTRLAEKALLYRAWVEKNRAHVENISGGKLGYVHLYDMTSGALDQFFIDLDVQNHEREGVVIDVRNNNGGFIDPYAIDVLARRDYISLFPRGETRVSERTRLGQRALGLPTTLLVNEHSLSDAENFTEGYRRLHLGPIVGVPTAGWIIFTGGAQLIDGSNVRLPFWGTYGADGTDMELHPRPVDVRVERRLGEADRGADAQLDTAVRVLLTEVGRRH